MRWPRWNTSTVVRVMRTLACARALARHRVVVTIDLHVVVDTDPRHFPFGVLVVSLRQGPQRRLAHLGEVADAAAGQFFEWPLVQVSEPRSQ